MKRSSRESGCDAKHFRLMCSRVTKSSRRSSSSRSAFAISGDENANDTSHGGGKEAPAPGEIERLRAHLLVRPRASKCNRFQRAFPLGARAKNPPFETAKLSPRNFTRRRDREYRSRQTATAFRRYVSRDRVVVAPLLSLAHAANKDVLINPIKTNVLQLHVNLDNHYLLYAPIIRNGP